MVGRAELIPVPGAVGHRRAGLIPVPGPVGHRRAGLMIAPFGVQSPLRGAFGVYATRSKLFLWSQFFEPATNWLKALNCL